MRRRPRLRLFTGEDAGTCTVEPTVSVRLSEIVGALLDAARSQRTWVQDFCDDEIQVSPDLYEVITAYSHLRPSA